MRIFFLFIFITLFQTISFSNNYAKNSFIKFTIDSLTESKGILLKINLSKKKTLDLKFKKTNINSKDKITASILTILVGVFGVHRLYLGTDKTVPLVYSLTLGGGCGFLTITDLIAIITTKDISKFENNNSVFMWVKTK